MAFHSRSRLFGLLLILASLPMDPSTANAASAAASFLPTAAPNPAAEAMEARLKRISAALREQGTAATEASAIPPDAVAWVGWGNGGGGVRWGNGGFRNGGWGNGGFRNGGFRNGGWGNGGGGWRNFRNW
jgi:rSAM-associated Gly-rich repeat protein